MVSRRWQIAVLFITLLSCSSCSETRKRGEEKRNIPVALRSGDIAFRRGMGAASRAVLMANARGSFSHVGIVVNIDGEWQVIHEVPYESDSEEEDHICSEPIEVFLGEMKAASGAIYRLEEVDSLQRTTICKYVMRQFDQKTPFDHDYDLADTTHLYCSEMVWRSYLEVGIDLSEGRRTRVTMPGFSGEHIMPADIEQNDKLEQIFIF